MKKIIPLCFLLLFISCDIMKKSEKTKVDNDLTEQITTTVFRKGDTVTYEVPNYIIKDTTIYTVSREGTTLKTVYDQTGRISNVDCYSSEILEKQEINRRLLQQLTEKSKEKTEKVDNTFLIVCGVVLIVLGVIGLLLFFVARKQNQAMLALLQNKL